ncbi:MAG: site-2 protease family protein [Candidatus Gracilibacteria bacterium]|nr:site-2 protease family protein [Candidatus Gracilibacteria bacterium]
MFIGILVSLIIFSVIVLAHEYGHFKTARMFGVKVYEFGLGIPPKAKKLWKDKKGTEYTLNWLPIGGFVRLKGENYNYFFVYNKDGKLYKQEELVKVLKSDTSVYDAKGNKISKEEREDALQKIKENSDEDNLINKSYIKQSIVILAGVIMNFLLAIIIYTILFTIGVKPIGINDKLDTSLDIKLFPTTQQALDNGLLIESPGVVLFPLTGSLAQTSGIKDGDILLKINDFKIDTATGVQDIISSNIGKEISLELKREENTIDLKMQVGENGKIGTYLVPNIDYNPKFNYKYDLGNSVIISVKEVYGESLLTFEALGSLFRKLIAPKTIEERDDAVNSMSGPVGIVGVVNDALKGGVSVIVILACLISINLGVFNLLPIPALDGGRFLFITVNAIIRKTIGKKGISPRIEGIIHLSFFVIFIFLSIIITYNDVLKLINK